MRTKPSPPQEKDILDAIRASGYPLEIRVGRELERRGYGVLPSWNFFDPQLIKSRELDIAARRTRVAESGEWTVRFHVLVECKVKSAGVVGFRSVNQSASVHRSWMGIDLTSLHPEEVYLPGNDEPEPIMLHAQRVFQWGLTRYEPLDVTADQVAFLRPAAKKRGDAWTLDQSEGFSDHILPLCLGYSAYRATEMATLPEGDRPELHFASVVVVTEGPVWVATVSAEGETIENAKKVTYYRHLTLPHGTGVFRIDFVESGALTPYLDWLTAQQEEVVSCIESLPISLRECIARMRARQATETGYA